MSQRRGNPIRAADGLPARNNGAWAKDKLSFLDEFVRPALQATSRKLERHYLDLFAGPGINVDGSKKPPEEFEGSALRVLPMRAAHDPSVFFTSATLVNKDERDFIALRARVERLFEAGSVGMSNDKCEMLHDDANHIVGQIMPRISKRAYVLAFADIEKPNQLPWTTIETLKKYGHESMDLYVLFPLAMALNRLISYNASATEDNARALTRFYGHDGWRELARRRITDAHSPELHRSLLELYEDGLRGLGWKHVLPVRDVRRTGRAGLYKMLLATSHLAGQRIANWSAAQQGRDQGSLF